MTKQSRFYITVAISVLAVGLLILGLVILPDTIVMQIQANGTAGTTMSKYLGLMISFAISVVFAVLFYIKNGRVKDLVMSLIGLVLFGFTFYFNV